VRIVQAGGRVGFPAESPLKVLVLGQMRGQKFKSDDPVSVGVVGPPHLTHAAAPQQLHQAVATEGRSLQSVLPCHGQDASDSRQPAHSIRTSKW
jgi:hypothetical protein